MAFSSWRTWVTGETVTAAHMNQEIRDNGNALFPDEYNAVSWTHGLSGTVANPAVDTVGRRYRVGAMQFVWARFTITSVGGGEGTYFVTLPTSASGVSFSSSSAAGQIVGAWALRDNSAALTSNGSVQLRAADQVMFIPVVTHSSPFTIATGDILSFHAVYPIA
jgi:hypothetical protein